MKKSIIYALVIANILFIGDALAVRQLSKLSSSAPMVGGCGAPIFFTTNTNNKNLINEIPANSTRVRITYPSNLKQLAIKINNKIKSTTKAIIILEQVDLVDTPTLKYRHDAVIVETCFN